MNTAQDWLEMCIVKRKLDDTIDKINDMFIDISDGCQFKKKYCSNDLCTNEEHIDSGGRYNAYCRLEKCPTIENGVIELDIANAEGSIA